MPTVAAALSIYGLTARLRQRVFCGMAGSLCSTLPEPVGIGVSGQQVERITSYERTHSPCCGCRSRPRLRRRATQGSAGSRPRRYRARHAPASPPPPVGPAGYTVRHHVSSLIRRTCSHSGSSTSLEAKVVRNPPTGWGMGKPGFPIPLLEGCAPTRGDTRFLHTPPPRASFHVGISRLSLGCGKQSSILRGGSGTSTAAFSSIHRGPCCRGLPAMDPDRVA